MTPRDRRALIVGLSIVLTAALGLRVLPRTVQWTIAGERDLGQRTALLAHARAELIGSDALADTAARLTQRLASLAPKLLSGDNAVEAQSDLAARVNLAAARHQVKVERIDALSDSSGAGRLRRTGLRISVECDIRGINDLLAGLASGAATLSVEEVQLKSSDAPSPSNAPEVLKGVLTISGWYLAQRELRTGHRGEQGL